METLEVGKQDRGKLHETIRGNWKKWIVNAVINAVIITLITGFALKWVQLEKTVSRTELKEYLVRIESQRKAAMDLNTAEHRQILEAAQKYTDGQIRILKIMTTHKIEQLNLLMQSSLLKQDLILRNQKEWLKEEAVRLSRLENLILQTITVEEYIKKDIESDK